MITTPSIEPLSINTTALVQIPSRRILELDGLRAFAIAFVLLYHMSHFAGSIPTGPYWIAKVVSHLGQGGVNLFFIISGFIITTLLMRERESSQKISLSAFYTRRFCRIVPPFACYLLVLLVLRSCGLIFLSNKSFITAALFLGNTGFQDFADWFVGHSWSLSVEEQFYMLFPPLFCVMFGRRTRIMVILLCALYGLSLVSYKLANDLSRHGSPHWAHIGALYFYRYIIVGVLLATHGRPVLSYLTNKPRLFPLLLGLLVLLLFLAGDTSHKMSLIIASFEPLLLGIFVMWFVQNPSLCAPLRWRVVQWLGACSYSIYLWQQLLTGSPKHYHNWDLAQSPWALGVILLCATLSYFLIERPCIQIGRVLSARLLKKGV